MKLYVFGPRYNLKQNYLVLFPSYNLQIEKYKKKHNLLTIDLSLEQPRSKMLNKQEHVKK